MNECGGSFIAPSWEVRKLEASQVQEHHCISLLCKTHIPRSLRVRAHTYSYTYAESTKKHHYIHPKNQPLFMNGKDAQEATSA